MPVNHKYQSSQPRHPIQVVARRTGLSQDVIRAWERRHHAVAPERSGTARRLYSDDDVDRLVLLRRATLQGRRIGDIAHLPSDDLRSMVERDDSETEKAPVAPGHGGNGHLAAAHLESCLDAVRTLDSIRLEAALSKSALTLGTPALMERVLAPLLRQVGDLWQDGTMTAGHEHLASVLVASLLNSLRSAYATPGPGPEVVVTTPAGQLHELGSLMAAVAAASTGWKVSYLGPNLPAEEIAAAAGARHAKAVALSIIYPVGDPRIADELRRLRDLLPAGSKLLVGGSGAPAYERALRSVGATTVESVTDFVSALQAIK